MNDDLLTSKTTGKRLGVKITLIALALVLGAGITLLGCNPDLRIRCQTAVAGALSLDKPAAAAGFTAVTTDSLNVRSGEGTSSPVICTLPKGSQVEMLAKPSADAAWVQVKTSDGQSGWCLKTYLDFNELGNSSSSPVQSAVSAVASSSASQTKTSKAKTVAAAQVSLEQANLPLSIQVSIADQKVTIYDAKKRIVKQFICSTGTKGSETPTGTYKIAERGTSFYSKSSNEGGYYWTQFHGDYLFHSVPFDENYKMEPEEAAKLGTPASHGCVRLAIPDAKWIYDHVSRGTSVTIK